MGRLKETKRRLRFSVVVVLNAENKKKPKQESTGKNLAKEPYRKPTQVGRCGKH